MKNTIIVLLSALFLVSCQSTPKKDYILLSGTISGASEKEFRLYKRKSGADLTIVKLAEDGTFSSDTITTGTGYYAFGDGGRNSAELYLINGGEYNLTAIVEKFRNTAKLTGPNSDASNYLLSKKDNMDKLRGSHSEFYSLNESDFIAKQKMLHKGHVNYLDSFPNIPKEFVERERKELYYYNLLNLTYYEDFHRRYTKQSDFKVSADFVKQFEGVDFHNEELYKLIGSYRRLVLKHYEKKAESAAEISVAAGKERYFDVLKVYGAIPNDHIKNDILMSAAPYHIGYTDNIDEYYNAYMAVSTSEENNEIMTKKYKGLKRLSAGATSPIFENYVNHAGGTTSLSDFKGKYIYIDIWATWCGPCLQEVPFLQEVEKKYHGKNLEFVSISIDSKEKRDAWRKMVTDEGFSGVQLIADKDFNSDFIAAYEINSIPRFIIIDPEGKIVSSNATRPSDPDLIVLLDELNI
ncbi:TlpA disulfide reductase family protein [Flavivirga aquimarina]|uniref:TlpA disulfide reductase family protein n=1 Tax=Flavivirga aquimarina TaxID=2027862 RepID=A0ABT8WB54_9FLAO|nr:TlpA disulfide reductase family protein [Flavivirga aquimarina]MDO5970257.1 TlpA disulfide reductase family protein [Flavivirga aquimarina]